MTKRKGSTTGLPNDMPEPDDDLSQDVANVKDFGAKGDGSTNDAEAVKAATEPKLYPCTIGTPNAIIGTKKYAVGDEVEGGLTAHDIRKHRRAGIAIHCDELDNSTHSV